MNEFEIQLLRVVERAAIACFPWIGQGESKAADRAAVNAMREQFNHIDINGKVVIGEGERDEAPMLYIGEMVGSGKGDSYDIAVDPLEGTNLCAQNLPNSVSVFAISPKGTLLHAPDTYMDKIAVGPKIGSEVSLSRSVRENLEIVAQKLNKKNEEVNVVMLKRDRHKTLESEINEFGAKINFISDGDVFGAISTTKLGNNDILLGIGAAPEGVLAASALKGLNGYMEGKLKFRNDEEIERSKKYGIKDLDKIFTIDELVKGNDSAFFASGVTNGDLLKGVRKIDGKFLVNSIMIKKEKVEIVENTI